MILTFLSNSVYCFSLAFSWFSDSVDKFNPVAQQMDYGPLLSFSLCRNPKQH